MLGIVIKTCAAFAVVALAAACCTQATQATAALHSRPVPRPKTPDVAPPIADGDRAAKWVIRCKRLIDGKTAQIRTDVAVVVEGGKLSDAGRKAVRAFIKDQALGVKNAGRILLLETEGDRVTVRIEKLNLDVQKLIETSSLAFFRDSVLTAHGAPPRLVGVITAGQLGSGREIEGQLRIFRETVLRPKRRRLERVVGEILKDVEPGVTIQFNQMDITDIRSDADFFEKMLKQGVYLPEDVRALLEPVVE